MSACEELEGMPNHQVIRFQTMPPISPQAMAIWVTPEGSWTNPFAMVAATAVP